MITSGDSPEQTMFHLVRPSRITQLATPWQFLAVQVGSYTLTSARLDHALSQLIAALVTPAKPRGNLTTDMMMGRKIDLLSALLPITWTDGDKLIGALRRIARHRNYLAHSFWDIDAEGLKELTQKDWDAGIFWSADPPIVIRSGKKESPFDPALLHDVEEDQTILSAAVELLALNVELGVPPTSVIDWVKRWGDAGAGWLSEPTWKADVDKAFRA